MWRTRIVLLLIASLLLISLVSHGAAAPPPQGEAKVHPALWRLSAEHPDGLIPVIVQLDPRRPIEQEELPGVTGALDFVNARLATVSAQALKRLAANPKVRYISYDAPMVATELYQPVTAYPYAVSMPDGLWREDYAGQGVGVAVIDTGVGSHPDLDGRVAPVDLGARYGTTDSIGHGTHVSGIIAGRSANGRYVGIAPKAQVYSLRVVGPDGTIREGDLLRALQWVYENRRASNIRVVNISLQSSLAESYRTSAISAGVEQLWLAGMVVVVSAGNQGAAPNAMYYPPANDPFVITVGAISDNGTPSRQDDYVPVWSSRGVTQDGFAKPEVLAPGHRIVAPLAPRSVLADKARSSIIERNYIRLSGTSMAAPVVSGLAAAVLSYNPVLTPDQVKALITTQTYGTGFKAVDARLLWAAVKDKPASEIPAANLGLTPNIHLTNAEFSGTTVFDGNVLFENVLFENVLFENVLFDN